MPIAKPTYNLSGENWITKANRAILTKVNAETVLAQAKKMEKEKIEAGTHRFVSYIDQAGKKSLKFVKI